MFIPEIIATIIFATQFDCVQYMDHKITTRPEHSTVTYLNMHKAIISLWGADLVLVCNGKEYTAHLLTN
ncbi:MAG: hypothetical protein DRO67_00020 [Candidatus Asgardarchaeum californiense]|nr:MAG: hypothetical protein DRO67_00020 [Candidatus Asgardarchaeum californiense]